MVLSHARDETSEIIGPREVAGICVDIAEGGELSLPLRYFVRRARHDDHGVTPAKKRGCNRFADLAPGSHTCDQRKHSTASVARETPESGTQPARRYAEMSRLRNL